MYYLGIDQHAKQLTIDLGNEAGQLVKHQRVSTHPNSLQKFFGWLRDVSANEGGFVAVLEVTGFHDYLLKLLPEFGCVRVLLVQPSESTRRKSDRRDARALRETVWSYRGRLDEVQSMPGLRIVRPPSEQEAEDRSLTALAEQVRKQRRRALQQLQSIVRRYNLQHEMPTKKMDTKAACCWVRTLPLNEVDRFAVEQLLASLEHFTKQLKAIDEKLTERFEASEAARILSSTPGISIYSGVTAASRIGPVERFRNGSALANFMGVTPGCRNSGDRVQLGPIIKQGSGRVRHVLNQALVHVLRKDRWLAEWYRRIKRRRGAPVARVALVRKLLTIWYAMLRDRMPYVPGGPARYEQVKKRCEQEQLSFELAQSLAWQA